MSGYLNLKTCLALCSYALAIVGKTFSNAKVQRLETKKRKR